VLDAATTERLSSIYESFMRGDLEAVGRGMTAGHGAARQAAASV